jgi:hypothetical protein
MKENRKYEGWGTEARRLKRGPEEKYHGSMNMINPFKGGKLQA